MEPNKPQIAQWPVIRMKVADLVAYERNPRKVSPAAYDRLRKSIVENGYIAKVVATEDGKIIGGHVRIHALKSLGVEEIDVVKAPGPITEEQYKRLLLIDNIHAGEFDTVLIGADFSIAELEAVGMPQVVINKIEPMGRGGNKAVTDTDGYCLLVEFDTEAEQEQFYQEIQKRGIKCKIFS